MVCWLVLGSRCLQCGLSYYNSLIITSPKVDTMNVTYSEILFITCETIFNITIKAFVSHFAIGSSDSDIFIPVYLPFFFPGDFHLLSDFLTSVFSWNVKAAFNFLTFKNKTKHKIRDKLSLVKSDTWRTRNREEKKSYNALSHKRKKNFIRLSHIFAIYFLM